MYMGAFIFIPENVSGSVSDAVTDSEGESYVAPNVKVGDKAPKSDRVFTIVKSLSDSSIRCKDSKSLICAKIVGLVSN